MRWHIPMALLLVACGGGEKRTKAPKQDEAPRASLEAAHEALVAVHRAAVGACFGGFGNGAPYTVTMVVENGRSVKAKSAALSEKYGKFPGDCVDKHFTGIELTGVKKGTLSARFAVRNPACKLPACPADDQSCTFKRDISCSVVIDP